jgi:hypothetical protein
MKYFSSGDSILNSSELGMVSMEFVKQSTSGQTLIKPFGRLVESGKTPPTPQSRRLTVIKAEAERTESRWNASPGIHGRGAAGLPSDKRQGELAKLEAYHPSRSCEVLGSKIASDMQA